MILVAWLLHHCSYMVVLHLLTCVQDDKYIDILDELTMGWLRSVESIKLSVSFAEYSLFSRALLQKRLII